MDELDRRWGRAQGFGLTDARLLTPAEVAGQIPLLDPSRILGGLVVASDGIAKGVRAAEALGRASGARAFGGCEVTGFDIARGRVRGVRTTLGDVAADHVVLAAGIWGAKVARLAGLQLPIAPVQHQYALSAPLAELAGETREVAHPILRHQDHSMYFRQHADRYGVGNYRHEPLLTEPEDIRAPGGAVQPSILDFTPSDFAAAAREAGRAAAGAAGRALRAHAQRADVVHARRLPAAGRERQRARAVAGRGDLGHPLRRRGPRAGRADDPRRLAAGPARVRSRALRRPRALARLPPGARRAAVPRGLRRHPSPPAVRAGARAAPHAVLLAPGTNWAPCSSRAPAGSARSGTRPTRRPTIGPRRRGRRASGRRSSPPSTPRAASGWGSSTSRRSPSSR